VTHPCHPLQGAEVDFIRGPRTRSEAWVLVGLPEGELRKIPRAWTSLEPLDAYRLLPSPPALRIEALLELREWISRRTERRG
jgi:hypothetical protein